MSAMTEKQALIHALIEEASDVDLVCYLARSGGDAALKDLFECIRDAESLPVEALLYNISVVRQKKTEAYVCPLHRVFRRLMKLDMMSVNSSVRKEGGFSPGAGLH